MKAEEIGLGPSTSVPRAREHASTTSGGACVGVRSVAFWGPVESLAEILLVSILVSRNWIVKLGGLEACKK